jgi:hypothetical protein
MNYFVKQIVVLNPVIKESTFAYSDNFILSKFGALNIYHDLTKQDWDLILKFDNFTNINFSGETPKNSTLKFINENIIKKNKSIKLKVVLNGHGTFSNLDFLVHLTYLKNIDVDFYNNNFIAEINEFLDLEELSIYVHKLSIKEIAKQKFIKKLRISGSPKDVEIIGEIISLESLCLNNQTLKNIDFLTALNNLKELNFKLGGTKNLEALPKIEALEKLSFQHVRKLFIEDLMPINEMLSLNELTIIEQPHFTNIDWLTKKNIKVNIVRCSNFKS